MFINSLSLSLSLSPSPPQNGMEKAEEQVLEPTTRDGPGNEEAGVLPTNADGPQ